MGKLASEVISVIDTGKYDDLFNNLYVDSDRIPGEKERYKAAIEKYISLYGDGEISIFSAPGRSEIGGNHTDHQHGRVLATSLNIDVIAVASANMSNTVHIKSEGFDEISVDISELSVNPSLFETTDSLVRGICKKLTDIGYKTGGFNAYFTSEVLPGSGLSSSAAIEILLGHVFYGLFNEGKPDPVMLAITGKYAENKYFGKPSGLMDQMACSVGGLINIDFSDPKKPIVKKVEVDFEKYGHSLCIVDTKGSHADLTDEYARITVENAKVSEFFDKNVLREVDENVFYENIGALRRIAGDRAILRAIHFFEDNNRVNAQTDALLNNDFAEFKALIRKSGESSFKHLQNVYSIKHVEEQGIPLALAISEKILGKDCACRVHGGGFAGTIQAFVPNEKVKEYKAGIEAIFGKDSCQVLHIRQIGGCRVL